MIGGTESAALPESQESVDNFTELSLKARNAVRLLQCEICSKPFQFPVTLPCGYSVCRGCLPTPHHRLNISYPPQVDRDRGYLCPVSGCGLDHPIAECNSDVLFSKIISQLQTAISETRLITGESQLLLHYDPPTPHATPASSTKKSQLVHGNFTLTAYTLAQSSELGYHSEVTYEPAKKDEQAMLASSDEVLLTRLGDIALKELDCQVCFHLLYDPVTTPCGHTFCRKCLTMVLDHSTLCPVCRTALSLPPSLSRQPSNLRLVSLLETICSSQLAVRSAAIAQEESELARNPHTPLFVCALAFPTMPTFLHIFEPRYRLMIRRAIEGNGRFGILAYNRLQNPQGDLGITPFLHYGTMLSITGAEILPDGRSLIETVGVGRFRVKSYSFMDGYTVGEVETVEDMSMVEEERLEAEDLSRRRTGFCPHSRPVAIDSQSTQDLFTACLNFVQEMRARSAPWLHQKILDIYGNPPEDPASFPYWFASVLPIVEDERYLILKTTSVRQRLKVVVRWIHSLQEQS